MEFKIDNKKYWIDFDECNYYSTWYKFREEVAILSRFTTNKESIQHAEQLLINKYPEYKIFEETYGIKEE